MDKLIEELRESVVEDPDVSIINDELWKLPIVLYDVGFSRVKRLKMDILMKMLLLAFQEADIRRAATLSDMLFVEELFISDLIDKMQRTGLIGLEKPGYKLTAKGYDYLGKGIFDEEMDGDETVIAYSTVHDQYRLAEDNGPEAEETLPLYRYSVKGNLNKDRLQQLLSKERLAVEEESFQTVVTGITGCVEHDKIYIPCIEFQLYDRKQDIFYARVWNTLTGSWDETLEKQIEARELVKWRNAMVEQPVS
ncbi:hypothetical protein A1A1_17130 [Planococcus antarcticus DSM 14505]|uniref:Uncharacterized protein n=1 Tax=Planococcus antarcticus DSM 14505 TaxID=1185653 RepID=A0A1C7DKF9_9BACL|nr:hypothetical protein [Planococcus antarcticus]ANU11907.1 hypothetical protein BBH88_17450 [Planococcus antarcticus DSM 14505]EIM05273.1 hypothetical protein A1A1_17130 [Planococcus antarcticus DSM 14505]